MLTTIVTWIYTLFTTMLLGFGVAGFVEKVFHYQIKKPDSVWMAGMVTATVYAQYFSLFYKVGLAANAVLVLICGVVLLVQGKGIRCTLCQWNKEYSAGYKVFFLLLFVAWAYFTSRGYMHYDSDLYHGQSIRWIEEYGIVPGLGNLHERFAYNSSFFALSALYSMKFMLGDSMHTMNGFLALLLSVTCLPIVKSFKNKAFSLSDFARVGAVYYLTVIIDEVVAPASDYAVMIVIFFIVIRWLDALEEKNKEIAPFGLLCVVGAYALTLKLTAGLILILLVKPAYMLIQTKRVKEICVYLAMGLIVAVPWFARTVLISGWLLYPFTGLDLFQVDWKMDAYYIDIDAMQIKAWGRGLYAIGLLDTPITEWFPNWFMTTLSGMEKILVLGAMAAVTASVFAAIVILFKKKTQLLDILLVIATLVSSYLFWQTSAPLIRYGYAYVLLLVCVVFGWGITNLPYGGEGTIRSVSRRVQTGIYFAVILYGIYKLFTIGAYVRGTCQADYYIWQEDYGVYEVESYEIGGETFYYGLYGDRTGYDYFPSAPTRADIVLRGSSMKEGFCKEN